MKTSVGVGMWCGLVLHGLAAAQEPAAAPAREAPIVAVFKIEDKGARLERPSLDTLTDLLATALAEGGVFRIVPPADIRQALLQKQKESYKECYDEACQIELGRELAAGKSLSSAVVRLEDRCTVTLALYDLRSQTTDTTATQSGGCALTELQGLLEQAARKLVAFQRGGSPEPPPAAASSSAPAAPRIALPELPAQAAPAPVATGSIRELGEGVAYRRLRDGAPPAGKRKARLAALGKLQRALEQSPGSPEAFELTRKLARAHLDEARSDQAAGRVEAARSARERAVELLRGLAAAPGDHPLGDQVLFLLAEALWDLERPDESLEAYRQLVEVAPGSPYLPEAYRAFGERLLLLGDTGQAISAFRKAAEHAAWPGAAYARFMVAVCLVEAGDPRMARIELMKVSELLRGSRKGKGAVDPRYAGPLRKALRQAEQRLRRGPR